MDDGNATCDRCGDDWLVERLIECPCHDILCPYCYAQHVCEYTEGE